MLSDFLVHHRDEILHRSLDKIRSMAGTVGRSPAELIDDLSPFLDELIDALEKMRTQRKPRGLETTGTVAPAHAKQRLRIGFDVEQLVHDYGSLCDAITETAEATGTSIELAEYRVLSQSLDTGIAEAVHEFMKSRELADERKESERLGYIVHELRNALATALLSAQAIRAANLSVSGRTADALERSLRRQKELIDYLLSDIRLRARELKKELVRISDLLDEVEAGTALHARQKGIHLSIEADASLELEVDRMLMTSALMNLTLNAIKYTRQGGEIALRGRRSDGEILLAVEDECGGLPVDNPDDLFKPFVQGEDHTGLGLGLTITRQSVEAHGGHISVRNQPGKGCVFVISLPSTGDLVTRH